MGSDLFSAKYTTGRVSGDKAIEFVTECVGGLCVFIISVVGFCIVNFTIMKNALNGWYAVSPKIWDRVDEIKRASLVNGKGMNKDLAGNGFQQNQVMQLLGSMQWLILSWLPNVKAMSDFGSDGETQYIDPKGYFMKAIPAACVQIFIGVLIYYGYPSQIANKVASFGTGVFSMILENTDPVAYVESLPGKLVPLKFATDGALDDRSKAINKIAKEATTAVLGKTGDIPKQNRLDLALDVEQWVVSECMPRIEAYTNEDEYKMSVNAGVAKQQNGKPDVSYIDGQENDGILTFAWVKNIGEFDTDSKVEDIGSYWLQVVVQFNPKASEKKVTSAKCDMAVPASSWLNTNEGGTTGLEIKVANGVLGNNYQICSKGTSRAYAQVGGKEVTCNAYVDNLSGVITLVPANSKDDISGVDTFKLDNIYYRYGNTDNEVLSVTKGSGSATLFTPVDSNSGISSWTWGNGPTASSSEDSTGDSNPIPQMPSGGDDDSNSDETGL